MNVLARVPWWGSVGGFVLMAAPAVINPGEVLNVLTFCAFAAVVALRLSRVAIGVRDDEIVVRNFFKTSAVDRTDVVRISPEPGKLGPYTITDQDGRALRVTVAPATWSRRRRELHSALIAFVETGELAAGAGQATTSKR